MPLSIGVVLSFSLSVVLASSSEATFDSELATLVAEEASIVVLLAEGFDGSVIRTVLSQVRQAGPGQGGWQVEGGV